MKTVWGTSLCVAMLCWSASSRAGPITEGEKQFCKDDYKKYCGAYGLGTNALKDCMDKVGHSLSHNCVDALIDAGEVSRGEVERRKASGK
jgi:hypothetical protein